MSTAVGLDIRGGVARERIGEGDFGVIGRDDWEGWDGSFPFVIVLEYDNVVVAIFDDGL